MTQYSFDASLTQRDIELTTIFMMWLDEHGHIYFSSDLFREAHLDDGFSDPQHEIGTYFAKLKVNGVAVAVGEEPSAIASNNRRRVDLFRFDWARWRTILRSRLT